MKYAGYAWTVILGVAALGVEIMLFLHNLQPFERIVVSLLVMIYINLVFATASLSQQISKLALGLSVFILRSKSRVIGEETEEVLEAKDLLKETEEKARQTEIKFYINAVFNSIISLLAIANLLIATLS
jgi:hypothetical protein